MTGWPHGRGAATGGNRRCVVVARGPRASPAERSRWLPAHLERQDGKCHYCDLIFDPRDIDPMNRATLDHVVPLSRGGEDSEANTVAACLLCNTAKGDMLLDEALEALPAARVRILANRERRFLWRPRQAAGVSGSARPGRVQRGGVGGSAGDGASLMHLVNCHRKPHPLRLVSVRQVWRI